MAIVTCCIMWMSSAKIWSDFLPHLIEWRGVLSSLVLLHDDWLCSCWTMFKLYFLHDGYDYLRLYRAVGILSVLFCCSIGQMLFKAAAYVLLVLSWLFFLFSSFLCSWFGWLTFTNKFRVCFFGTCSLYLSWQYLRVFFLLNC